MACVVHARPGPHCAPAAAPIVTTATAEPPRISPIATGIAAVVFAAMTVGTVVAFALAVVVPLGPDSAAADAYFKMIDLWVSKLAEAYS